MGSLEGRSSKNGTVCISFFNESGCGPEKVFSKNCPDYICFSRPLPLPRPPPFVDNCRLVVKALCADPAILEHMEKYLSHWSALSEMHIPFMKSYFTPMIRKHTKEKHYVVFSKRHRYEKRGETVHLCSQKLPQGALRPYQKHPAVGPEFAFLQVAYDLSFHRLVLLGLLMCCTPQGRKYYQPVTTPDKLKTFVLSMERHRGRRRALRALQYVEGYSRSPMEILTYMLLCLPNHRGGAGFRGATFDYRIDLSPEDQAYLNKEHVFADLAYPEHKVLLEYNGADHEKPAKRVDDAKRAEVLEAMGYRVITVVADDLYKPYLLFELIKTLAEALGKPLRMEARTYADGFARILNMMPRRGTGQPAEDQDPNGFLKRALAKFSSFFEAMRVVPALQRSG